MVNSPAFVAFHSCLAVPVVVSLLIDTMTLAITSDVWTCYFLFLRTVRLPFTFKEKKNKYLDADNSSLRGSRLFDHSWYLIRPQSL